MHNGGRKGRGGGQHFGDASAGDFSLVEDGSSQTVPIMDSPPCKFNGWVVKGSLSPEISQRMFERSKHSHKTLQRYPTDSSRHCQSRTGLGKSQTLRVVPRI